MDYMKMYDLVREALRRLVLMGRLNPESRNEALVSVRNGRPNELAIAAYRAMLGTV